MRLIIILFVVLIIFILYILLFIKKPDQYKYDPLYNYQDIRKNMNTGDIILFSFKKNNNSLYKSLGYYVRTELIGSEYGHVGIIVRDKEKLFVLECVSNDHCSDSKATYLNNYGQGGIRIIDLDTVLKDYEGLYAIRFISKEIPYQTIMDKLEEYVDITFQDKKKIFILGFADVCISHNLSKKILSMTKERKIMCSGFVHHILNKCGALKDYPSELFWPHLITDDNIFDPLQIIKYSKIYKFKFT